MMSGDLPSPSVKSRPSTTATSNSRETWMTRGGEHKMGKGELIFTGPNGKKNHEVKIAEEHRFVGIGALSGEQTSEVLYLYRPSPNTNFPAAKASKPGAIGWGLPQKGDPRSWPLHLNLSTKEDFERSVENSKIIFNRR